MLRSVKTNDYRLLKDVNSTNSGVIDNFTDKENTTKILGMYWNQNVDAYQYSVRPYNENIRVTKRVVLSEISSVFDPLDLISPIVIKLKTLGNASLTYEELNTLFVRIEAILNSRPLTPLSTDPSDISVPTPGHFLIGNSLCALPDRNETAIPPNRLSRWRRVTQLSQHLWSRWSRDNLSQLQARNKWCKSQGPCIQVGTVVLIRDDNLSPLQWSIGRVIEIHVGADNQVRVATVKTSHGKFQRAVRNLCLLPFEDNQ